MPHNEIEGLASCLTTSAPMTKDDPSAPRSKRKRHGVPGEILFFRRAVRPPLTGLPAWNCRL